MADCFVDFMKRENCYNPFESYGMCCVGCGCCSENPLEQAKARLALHERLLEESIHFDLWFGDPELRAIQEGNVAKNIAWNKEQIATYKAIVSELEASGADGTRIKALPTILEAEGGLRNDS